MRPIISSSKDSLDHAIELTLWLLRGCAAPPPPSIKRRFIRRIARQFGVTVFVETGTLYGNTLHALRNSFVQLHSIELSQELYEKASARFSRCHNIRIWRGDSGEILPDVLKDISKGALFWLDGHYSGGLTAKGKLSTPIVKELTTILSHHIKDHVILIDDARCFTGENDYPDLRLLIKLARDLEPQLSVSIRHDIILMHR